MSASKTLGSMPAGSTSTSPLPGYAADNPTPAYASAFSRPTNFNREISRASRAQVSLERAYKKDMKKGFSPEFAQAMNQFKNAQNEFAQSARTGGNDIQQKHMAVLNAKSALLFNAPEKSRLRGAKAQKQLIKMMRADTSLYNQASIQACTKLGMPSPPTLKVPSTFRKDRKTVVNNQKQMRKSLDRLLNKSRDVDGRKLDKYQKDTIKKAFNELDARQSNFMVSLGSGSPDTGYAWDALKTNAQVKRVRQLPEQSESAAGEEPQAGHPRLNRREWLAGGYQLPPSPPPSLQPPSSAPPASPHPASPDGVCPASPHPGSGC